jgi:hypothetical protein
MSRNGKNGGKMNGQTAKKLKRFAIKHNLDYKKVKAIWKSLSWKEKSLKKMKVILNIGE